MSEMKTLKFPGDAEPREIVDAKARDEISKLSEEIVSTAESKVNAHNTEVTAHSDIRLLIQGLTDRLNALADSDDTTLDQLSEVVAYIKSNRTLIEAITTDKVSVADIVDNLTTNVANKPLSAAQGVALKALIDAISVPDKLPNPNALTFTGAVTGSYDGSAPLTVEIPNGEDGLGLPTPTAEDAGKVPTVNAAGDGYELETLAAGGGGESLIVGASILAQGTIANGTAAQSTTNTGLTVGDLRRYKCFSVYFKSSQSNYYGVGTGASVNWGRIQHTSITYLFEWLDENRTVLKSTKISGTGVENACASLISNVTNVSYYGNTLATLVQVQSSDDTPVGVTNYSEMTADATWVIRGLVAYAN